jgi:hypothetical protein
MIQNIKNMFIKAWSIGIYTGESPFNITELTNNPVLEANAIPRIPVYFIADPFLLASENRYYMFFEMLNSITGRGEIGYASSSDYISWEYGGSVLREKFHLSYPLVFYWNGDYYMVPESQKSGAIRIYIATDFPYEWKFLLNLMEGKPYRDSTILHYNDRWWLYTTYDDNNLLLFHSRKLVSDKWIEHPQSPVLTGRYARPGGRVILYNNRIIRFSQDLYPDYGNRVVAYEVKILTTKIYSEEQIGPHPFLGPSGKGWNAKRMHHVDCLRKDDNLWIIVADGFTDKFYPTLRVSLIRILQKIRSKIGL